MPIRREFIATQGEPIVQAGDIVDLNNFPASMRILDPAHDTFKVMLTPLWDHEDLPDGRKKYLASFVHDPAFFVYDAIFYERVDAATGRWCFRSVAK